MTMKTMDPELAAKLIEGVEDILTKRVEEVERRKSDAVCPMCGGELQYHLNPTNPFTRDGIARPLGKCMKCGELSDPLSGLIIARS